MIGRDGAEYLGFRLAGLLVRGAPRAAAQNFATGVARRYFDRGGKRARWTVANLRIAFPELPEERAFWARPQRYAEIPTPFTAQRVACPNINRIQAVY